MRNLRTSAPTQMGLNHVLTILFFPISKIFTKSKDFFHILQNQSMQTQIISILAFQI
jgi:hypothetical protein